MENSSVPPGFRFHPTDEELVGYYLTRKVSSLKIDLDVIMDIDLYRIEPWDIQDRCKMGYEEQKEWYFFSYKDRKYPTGTRTNRATASGFWKATGRDKAVLSKEKLIGMRKTLVFYRGRAPNGKKTDWIMHEYRLQTSEHEIPQEEGWVVCRAFKKPTPYHKQGFEYWHDPMMSYARSDFRHPPLTGPTTSSLAHNNNNNNNNSLNLLNQETRATSFNHQPPLNDGNSFMELRNLESSMGLDRELSKSGDKDEYWKGFDKVIEPSWVDPNMALLISSDTDGFAAAADHQTRMSHVLECFPADL